MARTSTTSLYRLVTGAANSGSIDFEACAREVQPAAPSIGVEGDQLDAEFECIHRPHVFLAQFK